MNNKPPFNEFSTGMMAAVSEVMQGTEGFDLADTLKRMEEDGAAFSYPNSGIDSLDMLDIVLSGEKKMGIRINLQAALVDIKDGNAEDLTMSLLYKHTWCRE